MMQGIRAKAQKQARLLAQVEALGNRVTRKYVAAFQAHALKALRSGGRVNLSAAEVEAIVDELADLMLLGFVRRYRQEKNALGIELNLSFSREVEKLARNLDLDLGNIRSSFAGVARGRVGESVASISDRINAALADITAKQQPTAIATKQLRRRLDEMGLTARRPSMVETLIRTHSQISFSAAQWQLDTQDDAHDVVWGWMLSVVGDDRMSDICIDLDGFAAAKDDEIWNTMFPPLHFNCRTQAIVLTEPPAELIKLPRGVGPAPGFDFHPGHLLA